MGKRAQTTTVCDLMCMECGSIFPIHRKAHKLKEENHIKDLWCVNCKKTTKHVEKFKSDSIPGGQDTPYLANNIIKLKAVSEWNAEKLEKPEARLLKSRTKVPNAPKAISELNQSYSWQIKDIAGLDEIDWESLFNKGIK